MDSSRHDLLRPVCNELRSRAKLASWHLARCVSRFPASRVRGLPDTRSASEGDVGHGKDGIIMEVA